MYQHPATTVWQILPAILIREFVGANYIAADAHSSRKFPRWEHSCHQELPLTERCAVPYPTINFLVRCKARISFSSSFFALTDVLRAVISFSVIDTSLRSIKKTFLVCSFCLSVSLSSSRGWYVISWILKEDTQTHRILFVQPRQSQIYESGSSYWKGCICPVISFLKL
jgi:hypothetical protein